VSSLALSAPATAVAGTPFSVTVTAKDNYNQTYTVYTGTVHFSSSDPRASLPTDYTFTAGDAGSHTFSLALNTAGPQTFTVTDTSNSTLTVTSGTITVSPGPTARRFVSGPGTTVAGNAASVTVTAQDAYGNTTPGYTGTVHFTSSDPQAILPANYTYTGADNGTHSFSVTLKTAGSQTVTASDTSSSSLSGSVTISVSPAAAQSLVLTAPSSAAAGSPLNVSVTALDPYGNLATGYRGTLHFTSTDPAASISLPANSTFTASDAGSHVFSATLQTLGTQTITATDTGNGSLAGTTPAITISAAPLTVPLVVSTGWNLIGGTPVTVYPDATSAWSWNATSGQWSSMSQGAQPSLPLGEGTWEELRGGTSEQVQVEGCTASVAISVFPHRWNMVGNPCNVPVTLPAGSRALGWTPSSQSYQPITQLPAGGAAWVVPPSSVLSLTP
jgi:hypothetical protein